MALCSGQPILKVKNCLLRTLLTQYRKDEFRGTRDTGQIQNPQVFFGAGIAEVPTENCSNSGVEFGARVRGGISADSEKRKRRRTPSRVPGAYPLPPKRRGPEVL